MSALERFKKILVDNDCRNTESRLELFKLLLGSTPLTMNEIIVKLNGKSDRVSIYRNTELFEKLGIVNKLYFGWKYKIELSDEFIGHHHHLICLECGSISDIKGEKEIENFIQKSTNEAGFKATRHTFDIEGYCQKCI